MKSQKDMLAKVFCPSWLSAFAVSLVAVFSISATPLTEVYVPAQRAQAEAIILADAARHENVGEWREALTCWEKWSPLEDCTGEESATKNYHIAACLLRLGDTLQAVSNCLRIVFGPEQRGSSSAGIPLLLLKLYQATDQVPDLVRMADNYERKTMTEYREKGYFQNQPETNWLRLLPTRPIREALRIKELQSQEKIVELIAVAQDSSWTTTDLTEPSFVNPDWRCRMAANALSELGEAAVNAIEPISSEVEKRKGNTSWLIYALGKSKATNALNALAKGTRQETSYNSINFVYAIAQHGEKGHELLKEIAEWKEHMQNGIRVKARAYLADPKPYPPSWLDVKLPKIKRGSLPKSYLGMGE
jgi:hypothetical protein